MRLSLQATVYSLWRLHHRLLNAQSKLLLRFLPMSNTIYEWYGYHPADRSDAALEAALDKYCPFLRDDCTKVGGACTVARSDGPVIVCPNRLYFDNFAVLRDIAQDAFGHFDIERDLDGHPKLYPGDELNRDFTCEGSRVGVFGNRWSGEIKLPPVKSEGGARYSVDFTLVVADREMRLKAFVPVEVQTIDTTGSYRRSIESLEASRTAVPSKFGMNWENVNKRILPQLITKGLMLQGERLCTEGIFFVTPKPVFTRIMRRLGGVDRFRKIPRQPGSITFLSFEHDEPEAVTVGEPRALIRRSSVTISTSDMSLAFVTPQNLPPAGSYETTISSKLGRL